MKYVILADSDNVEPFIEPRQLSVVNGEVLLKRTVRQLKENGIKDILITSHDKRFDDLGATRYEPLHNEYNGKQRTGYWLNAFPQELIIEPITFLLGDVYYSDNAIKTIVESKTDSILFYCTHKNTDSRYIKHHDEPLGFKIKDCELFKAKVEELKKMFDEGKTARHPIAWELYRLINNQDVNVHQMTTNYIAINDETCDIDCVKDVGLLNMKVGGVKMIKCKATEEFSLNRFNEIVNLVRYDNEKKEKGMIYINDEFECQKDLADYLLGDNLLKRCVIQVLEVIPIEEKKKEVITKVEETKNKNITKIEKPKRSYTRKSKK